MHFPFLCPSSHFYSSSSFSFFFFFFFSSRRRHTRSLCDWSSDVCSSDLGQWVQLINGFAVTAIPCFNSGLSTLLPISSIWPLNSCPIINGGRRSEFFLIGRESGGGRGEILVVGGLFKKKKKKKSKLEMIN